MKTERLAGFAVALVLAACICGVAAQEMGVGEIGTVAVGETVTIGGTTNLAPGNHLLVTVTPVGFGPTNKSTPAGPGGVSGVAVVERGEEGANTWSFVVDTTGFEPGEYSVAMEWIEGGTTASTTFSVLEVATTTPTVTATPAETTPPASPTPTTTGTALPMTALAAGLIGYLLRKK
ncbi:MAG: hypothetical protein GX837_06320 [Methanomicrobiales archaeon]|nr:hypothetical protein [Methanomicrobiales archaeon]